MDMPRRKRIAIFNVDAYGELLPTLPLTRALVANGHIVDYLAPDSFARKLIETTGAHFHSCGEGFDPAVRYLQNPTVSLTPTAARARASIVRKGYQMLPRFISYCEAAKPDVIVFNRSCVTAKICADHFGIPSAMIHPSYCGSNVAPGLHPVYDVSYDRENEEPFEALLSKMAGEYPESPESLTGLFADHDKINIVLMSREFHPESERLNETYHFVGPQILAESQKEKQNDSIYVSLGTICCLGRHAFFRACVDAFAHSQHRTIISIGAGYTPDDFGPLPQNITVLQHVDQLDALSRAFAFITHGGMGSIQEAIWWGVPTVVVPRRVYDQTTTARRVGELQCGMALSENCEPSPTELAQAVEFVSNSESIRHGISRQRDFSRRAGGVAAAEALVRSL